MIVIRRDWTNSRIKILEEGIGIFTIEEIKDIANSRFEWEKSWKEKSRSRRPTTKSWLKILAKWVGVVSQAKWSRRDRSNVQRTGSNWSPLATGQIMQPLSACISSQPDLISNIAPGVSIPIIISRSPSSRPTPADLSDVVSREDRFFRWIWRRRKREKIGGQIVEMGTIGKFNLFGMKARKIGRRRIFARRRIRRSGFVGIFRA